MIKNMKVCQEFAKLSHLDCGNCNSKSVELLGTYKMDKTGFYVDVKCHHCDKVSDCGDGEFLTEVATFDGEQFHLIEDSGNIIPSLDQLLEKALPRVSENGKWLYESGSEDMFGFEVKMKDYIVNIDLHSSKENDKEVYEPLYRVYVTSIEDGTQEDEMMESPKEALSYYQNLIKKYNK